MKDPAFLFYSKDFYEGTRTMLPEERACYIDLMIYQHQNGGYIPNDLKRVLMYCSGISEATLQATLEAKFKLCDKGWFNHKLKDVVSEREKYSEKQSINGKVGQFFKQAKKELSAKDYKKLRSLTAQFSSDNRDLHENWILQYNTPQATLEALLKHLANVNGIEINEDEGNGGVGEKETIPTLEEFEKYAISKKPDVDLQVVKLKYEAWKEGGWRTSGKNGHEIKNWRATLLNTIPYLKEKNSNTKINAGKLVKQRVHGSSQT